MIYYWCRSASFITGALSSFILNAAVPSQYESKYTREMRRSSGVLFTYFQFACSYLLTSLPHLCLWSRCSKHSCIAPAWTSADVARALFGLDQHPSTCKPGHLSPSHLKIENCENWEERGRLGVTTLISSHLCVQSVWQFYLRFDSWRMNKSSIILSLALKVLSLKFYCAHKLFFSFWKMSKRALWKESFINSLLKMNICSLISAEYESRRIWWENMNTLWKTILTACYLQNTHLFI